MGRRRTSDTTIVQIGKNGITDNTYEEILKNLRKNKEIRVKLLRNFLRQEDRFSSADKIIKGVSDKMKINSKIIGNVLIIRREQNK